MLLPARNHNRKERYCQYGACECSLLSFYQRDMAGRSQLGCFSLTGICSGWHEKKAWELETDGRTKTSKTSSPSLSPSMSCITLKENLLVHFSTKTHTHTYVRCLLSTHTGIIKTPNRRFLIPLKMNNSSMVHCENTRFRHSIKLMHSHTDRAYQTGICRRLWYTKVA